MDKEKNLKVSLVIPCFNEESVIPETYSRLKKIVSLYPKHELLFVDDGSLDNTMCVLEEIAKADANVKVLSFSRNFGHQPAVSAGLQHCTGDVAIIMDADLQDPPEVIPKMIDKYRQEQCNVVYGVRDERLGEGIFKKITAKLFYRFIKNLAEIDLPLDAGDFRLVDRKVIAVFKSLNEKNKYIRGIISWVGFRQAPIHYTRDSRFAGKTKYSLSKMAKFAQLALFYFTKKPLMLPLYLGLFSFFVGIILTAYALVAKFSSGLATVPGWASTLIVIIFFGGVQLIITGILGGYIGSIFDEVKNRPEYIIDRKINF